MLSLDDKVKNDRRNSGGLRQKEREEGEEREEPEDEEETEEKRCPQDRERPRYIFRQKCSKSQKVGC